MPNGTQVDRPEFVRDSVQTSGFGVVEKPLTTWERIYNQGAIRKAFLLLALATLWEVYARIISNDLLLPTFSSTVSAFWTAVVEGGLLERAWFSLKLLLQGYAIGLALATILTVFAISTRIGNDLLETLTSMFNPLPAIALLPLALIWFGLGTRASSSC